MTDHREQDTSPADAPADDRRRVRVPTSKGRPDRSAGERPPGWVERARSDSDAEYVEADPEHAWQWDARRWERIS